MLHHSSTIRSAHALCAAKYEARTVLLRVMSHEGWRGLGFLRASVHTMTRSRMSTSM